MNVRDILQSEVRHGESLSGILDMLADICREESEGEQQAEFDAMARQLRATADKARSLQL